MAIPTLNAINWNTGLDQLNRQQDVIARGSQQVGQAMQFDTQMNEQSNARGQAMAMDGLKFYADYDQREDAAKRDQTRLQLDQERQKADMDWRQKIEPLKLTEAQQSVANQKQVMDQSKTTFEQGQAKYQEDKSTLDSSRAALISDFEKKNRVARKGAAALKEGTAYEKDDLPPNWDQMTAQQKFGFASGSEEVVVRGQNVRKGEAEVATAEGTAKITGAKAGRAAEMADIDVRQGRAGVKQTEASTALARATTEKVKTDLIGDAFKLASQAGQQKTHSEAVQSAGESLYVPKNDQEKVVAEREEKNVGTVEKAAEAFASKKAVNDETLGILFGEDPKGKDGKYTDAQMQAAFAKAQDGGFVNTPEGQRLLQLEKQMVFQNKALLGGGPLSDSDLNVLNQLAPGSGANVSYEDFASLRKRLYGSSNFQNYVNTTKAQEDKDRKAIASTLDGNLQYTSPARVTRLMQTMAGSSADSNFQNLPLKDQARKAFGFATDKNGQVITETGADGRPIGKPRWDLNTEAAVSKYNQYLDYNKNGGRNSAPAQVVQMNPYAGAGTPTAERAFTAATKTSTLAAAPPDRSQPMAAPNGVQIAPAARGAYLQTPDLNGNYSIPMSARSGAPALATPRPKNMDEFFKSNGYNSGTAANVLSSFN